MNWRPLAHRVSRGSCPCPEERHAVLLSSLLPMPSLGRDPGENFWEETEPKRIGQRRHCCKLERKPEKVDHREEWGGSRELGAGQ